MTKLIPLTRGKFTTVDDEDFDMLNKFKWYCQKGRNTFYAKRKPEKNDIFIHHILMNPGSGYIDHIDGNGLNNQKSNLRIVSKRQNAQNLHIIKTSKYPGVHWHKGNLKWQAGIRINGKLNHLGIFESEKDAGDAYIFASNLIGQPVIT